MNIHLQRFLTPRKYLIAPRHQIRFAISFVALGLVSQSISIMSSRFYLNHAVEKTADLHGLGTAVRDALDQNIIRGVLIIGLWTCLLSVLLTLWFVLRYSHRFYGPCIPIERVLKEMAQGRYGQQIRLRHDDELGGIRDCVNALSAKLAETRKEEPPLG